MNTMTLQLIENEINDLVQKQQMFTVHDITKAIRAKSGKQVNIRHDEVRDEVINLFINGYMTNYTRTLANLPNVTSQQPFIYHHYNSNPNDYNVVSTTQIPTPIPTPAQTPLGNNAKRVTVDARGTLCIPNAFLTASGIGAGDRVQVTQDNSDCVTVGKMSLNNNLLTTYKVDNYGNVRITQSTLNLAGLGGKEYDISQENNQVSISKVA